MFTSYGIPAAESLFLLEQRNVQAADYLILATDYLAPDVAYLIPAVDYLMVLVNIYLPDADTFMVLVKIYLTFNAFSLGLSYISCGLVISSATSLVHFSFF